MSSEHTNPPDDRELETFLDGSSRISAAYRDASRADTAPLELDAAILAAARQTAAETRRRRPRWLQPLAVAATLMLSLGVLLSLWRDPAQRAQLTPQIDAPTPATSAASQASARDEDALHGEALMAPAQSTPAPKSAPRNEAGSQAHRAKRELKAMPPVAAPAPAPAAAADAAPVTPAPLPRAPVAEAPSERAPSSADAAGTAAPDATSERQAESARVPASAAAPAAAAGMSPALEPEAAAQESLLRIRKLLQAGEEAQARAALQDFVREHPDIALPEDLRELLRSRAAP